METDYNAKPDANQASMLVLLEERLKTVLNEFNEIPEIDSIVNINLKP